MPIFHSPGPRGAGWGRHEPQPSGHGRSLRLEPRGPRPALARLCPSGQGGLGPSTAAAEALAGPQAQGPAVSGGCGVGQWAPSLPLWSGKLASEDTGPPATPARPHCSSALTDSVEQEGKVQNLYGEVWI